MVLVNSANNVDDQISTICNNDEKKLLWVYAMSIGHKNSILGYLLPTNN